MSESLPCPYLQIKGRRFLVYQRPQDKQISRLVDFDPSTEKRYRPNIGIIVQVGDGYEPREWTAEEREEWKKQVPYQIGDRVVWSKYDEFVIRTRVYPEWWEGKTLLAVGRDALGNVKEKEIPALEAMRLKKQEETVEFVILKAHDIVGLLLTPEKEAWE